MSLFVENRSAVPVPNGWRIETQRLALTACDIEAAETLARIVALPRVFEPYYVEPSSNLWVKSDIESWCAQSPTILNVAARELNTGRVIGVVQFTGHQLAYLVDPELWGHGFGGEMVTACVAQVPAFLSLQELKASLLRDNRASQRIVERAGFHFVGLEQVRWGACAERTVLRYRWLRGSPCPAPIVSGCAD
jgi:RimJ/RimL family protein N-acetyltransferase